MRAGRLLVALMFFTVPVSAFAANTSHDGHWQVELETTVGNCQKSGVAVVAVKAGRVSGIDTSGVTPWGYIDGDNIFVGHFNSGQHVMRANGDVKGGSASGPWSSQTDFCGGRWTARKID